VIEHLHIAVSWDDGRVVTLDVSLHEGYADRQGINPLDDRVERVVPHLDPDELESDTKFRKFVQDATKHAANGEVVHASTLEDWRGLLLDRLGVGSGPVSEPIPYDAEGPRA
jgi:hypothetical protein